MSDSSVNPDPFNRPPGIELGELDASTYDLVEIEGGKILRTHPASSCLMDECVIHNPSDHPLRVAPMIWSAHMRLVFRRCTHDVLHPDPDSLAFAHTVALINTLAGEPALRYDGWHPCCDARCCGLGEAPVDLPFEESQAYMIQQHGDGSGMWEIVDPGQ